MAASPRPRRTGSSPQALRLARTARHLTLNPILYSDLASGELNNCLFDHLVMTDARGCFVPGRLVERWEVADQGTRWLFHLDADARWHDGRPVAAADAQFTFELILDPATDSPRRPEFIVDGTPIRFRALGTHLLEARLPKPFASFLDVLAWRPILPRHVHGRGPVVPAPEGPWPVGNGPFRVAAWPGAERIELEAVPFYHPRPAVIHRVVSLHVGGDGREWFAAARLDYLPGVSPDARAELTRRRRGVRFRQISDGNCTALIMRLDHPIFADRRVRRAMSHAIDRPSLARGAAGSDAVVAVSMVSPDRIWYHDGVPRYAHDVDTARHLLAEAGWRPASDGVLTRGAQRCVWTLLTLAHDEAKVEAARRLAGELRPLGMAVHVNAMDAATLVREHLQSGRFDAALVTWVPNFDIEDLYALYHSSQRRPYGWNYGGYRNPDVDALLERGRTAVDVASRRTFYDRAQELILADAPAVYLFHAHTVDAVAPHVRIPDAPHALGGRYLRLHEWRLGKPSARRPPEAVATVAGASSSGR